MIKAVEGILLGSSNARRLAKFYQEKVGLKIGQEFEMGEGNNLFIMGLKGSGLYLIDHKEVKGKNSQPARFILNLEVDDIEKEVEKVEKAGVKKIQDIYHVEDYGKIATFEDIDGNYFQFVQTRAK